MTTRAPKGLQAPGKALWKAITTDWDLDDREVEILNLACRQADALDELEARVRCDGITVPGAAGQTRIHPAVIEARQARVAMARLLGQLSLPAADGRKLTSAGERAQRAAWARWGTETREHDRHGRSTTGGAS